MSLINLTIASGASQSDVLELFDRQHLCGIIMPAAWTAAAITVLGCDTRNGTYLPMRDQLGAEISIAAGANMVLNLPPQLLAGAPFLRLRSGTAGTAVNQGGARTLIAMVRDYAG